VVAAVPVGSEPDDADARIEASDDAVVLEVELVPSIEARDVFWFCPNRL
jgi:hypothetical protein